MTNKLRKTNDKSQRHFNIIFIDTIVRDVPYFECDVILLAPCFSKFSLVFNMEWV